MIKNIFSVLLTFLIFFTSCQKKEENPLKSLKEKDIHFLSFYFYPSTLRMLNINNDPTFYSLTKKVKNAHYLQVQLSSEENSNSYNEWKQNTDWSDYEELMQATMDGTRVTLKEDQSNEAYVAIFQTGQTLHHLWIKGELDIYQLPKLMESGIDLGPINSFIENKEEDDRRREQIRKMSKAQQDSIASDQNTAE